ncbi:MAG: RNA polymerase sigma factor [Fimbriiglobus sp.]
MSPLTPTSVTLLGRLRRPDASGTDWGRFEALYRPLIRRWIGDIPGLGADADDITQEVFLVVAQELPGFDRQRVGSFRAWLRQVTVNRVRQSIRGRKRRPVAGLGAAGDEFLARLADPTSELTRQWDRDHDLHVLTQVLELVRPDFEPTTWEAFLATAKAGRSPAAVAADLGLSVNAVMLAKSRVLKRLREEAQGFLE